ncbi:S-adenosyl-L-methionine-dependent methyltransferase [Backusella circina FSU 941]|nr:S-adenosyl-L-methionine-dependent methyltransferase [Backusella circina FSU 941]
MSKQLKWIQHLTKACDGDIGLAKRQLVWLKEKILSDREAIGRSKNKVLSPKEELQLEQYISERVEQHKPLQYILGNQPFCDLDIVTKPPTLIPRYAVPRLTSKEPLRILDVCTGSGCIALALAAHLPKHSSEIVGMDISSQAIALANHNLNIHSKRLSNSVNFIQQDIFQFHMQKYEFNLIVSNPPYVTDEEYEHLDSDVKDWEDHRALVAPEQGTLVHKQIIETARYCHPFGDLPKLVMEIGGTHQVEVLSEALSGSGFKDIDVWKDLAGKDRVVIAS